MSWNIFCAGLVHVIIGACFDRLVISFSISCREKLVSLILLGLRVPKWYPQNLMVGTSLFSMDTEIEIVLFFNNFGFRNFCWKTFQSCSYIGARALSYEDRKFETKVMNLSCFTGFLKCWESSIDLVNVLKHEIRDGQLSFRGKRVLEVIQWKVIFTHHSSLISIVIDPSHPVAFTKHG